MNFEFHNPQAFWLLALIPVYLWIARRRQTTGSVRYPTIRNLKRLPRSLRQRMRWLLPASRTAGLILLIVVLARPIRQVETQQLPSEGIGIAMVVDRSASMANPENRLMFDDELMLRFDVARKVLTQFVEGDGDELKGRPNDLVGLFTFATYPRTNFPFSLDHDSMVEIMRHMEAEKPYLDRFGRPTDDPNEAPIVSDEMGRRYRRYNPMQFTSLKDAVDYVANKLILLSEDLKRPTQGLDAYQLKSKVMILLTDGEPTTAEQGNAPDFADERTIEMLTEAGIKVYFIQILSRERYREMPDGTVRVIMPRQSGIFGRMNAAREAEMANENIEKARELARKTGGEHFLATTGDQIKKVYEKIDALERSEIGGRTVFSPQERYQPILLAALALFVMEQLLAWTWLRRAP